MQNSRWIESMTQEKAPWGVDNLNKPELQELLRSLKVYRDLIKKVWNRGKHI